MPKQIPSDIKIAFVDQIESAAQGWKDGIRSYEEFRKILDLMALSIYEAGYKFRHSIDPYANTD